MTRFYATINIFFQSGQTYLESHIPEIPKDAMKGIIRSFACSFTASILLSGRKPAAGLAGGALAALATAIHIAFITGINNLDTYLCHRFNRQREPNSFEGRNCAFLLGWGGALYLGNALGLANNKASFLLTIPFLLWNNPLGDSTQTPVMGIAVV